MAAAAPPPRVRRGAPAFPAAAQPLAALDGPFALQEFLEARVRSAPHDVAALVALPPPSAHAALLLGGGAGGEEEPPRDADVDTDVWVYEQLR